VLRAACCVLRAAFECVPGTACRVPGAHSGYDELGDMDQLTQWCQAAVIISGYLLSVYFQNRRIDDLKDSVNKRFDDANKRFGDVNRRFDDTNMSINKRFDDLRDLLKSEVRRVEERIGHLEALDLRQK
jgi:hypothetical protein